jgi:hypothetical protein
MWQFIDRLVSAALPRTRDFQGINRTAVDSKGNLNIGIKEHLIQRIRMVYRNCTTLMSHSEEGWAQSLSVVGADSLTDIYREADVKKWWDSIKKDPDAWERRTPSGVAEAIIDGLREMYG